VNHEVTEVRCYGTGTIGIWVTGCTVSVAFYTVDEWGAEWEGVLKGGA